MLEYDARLLWAACCVGFFGFLRAGEFTSTGLQPSPSICVSDVAVSLHTAPSVVQVHLRRAKTDPFGHGVEIFLGKTGKSLCPVAAILNYLLIRPPGDGPLFVLKDRKPLTKDAFVKEVKRALDVAGIVSSSYAHIGVATSAAAAGVPAHLIKMMGCWTSEAYLLYSPRNAGQYFVCFGNLPVNRQPHPVPPSCIVLLAKSHCVLLLFLLSWYQLSHISLCCCWSGSKFQGG